MYALFFAMYETTCILTFNNLYHRYFVLCLQYHGFHDPVSRPTQARRPLAARPKAEVVRCADATIQQPLKPNVVNTRYSVVYHRGNNRARGGCVRKSLLSCALGSRDQSQGESKKAGRENAPGKRNIVARITLSVLSAADCSPTAAKRVMARHPSVRACVHAHPQPTIDRYNKLGHASLKGLSHSHASTITGAHLLTSAMSSGSRVADTASTSFSSSRTATCARRRSVSPPVPSPPPPMSIDFAWSSMARAFPTPQQSNRGQAAKPGARDGKLPVYQPAKNENLKNAAQFASRTGIN